MHSLENILTVTDLSGPGIHAAWRAGRIARAAGAALHLLKVIDGLDRHPSSRFGPSSPLARSRADLSHLAREISDALGVRVTHAVCADGSLASALQAARTADLIVTPAARRPRRWSDLLHGGIAERLLREAGVPVLIARRPSGLRYRRVLAAIDLSPSAEPLLALAARVCPMGTVEAFHAVSLASERAAHAAQVSRSVIGEHHHAIHEKARLAVLTLAHRAGVHEATPVVRQGDPARQLVAHQAQARAGLLVVGKTRRPWWADLLLGSLAQRLRARTDCDLLWVPTPALLHAPAATKRVRRMA